MAPTTVEALAGQATNDDIKDGHNAIHNGHDDTADSMDNGHDAGANGLKDALNLWGY